MKKVVTRIALLAMFAVVMGCAITDYNPYPGHKTTGEAKLAATEIAFDGFGYGWDGTFAYTVKYDNTGGALLGGVNIYTYHNPVFSSFTREGQIDVDGDYVQGRSGVLGGKFLPYWTAIDYTLQDSSGAGCEFDANLTYDHSPFGPGVVQCWYSPDEEFDADHELVAAFDNLDTMFKSIWSGVTGSPFDIEITGIRLDGMTRPVDQFPVTVEHAYNRPFRYRVTNGPGVRSMLQAILDNTEHMVPVQLGFTANSSLSFDLPANMKVAFNHVAIRNVLNGVGANNPRSPFRGKLR